MRSALNLIPILVAFAACGRNDNPPVDAANIDTAMTPAMATAITENDVAGTWKGNSTPEGSDSVIARWTTVCAAGTCKGTNEGSDLTIQWAYTLAGDSSVGVGQPYAPPEFKGAKVVDTWVARVRGDSVIGTGRMALAAKPDSVVTRYRFAGTRSR